MPRSGSTFLQCVLNTHPDIYAGGTDGCLELLFGSRFNFTNSPEFAAQDSKLMEKAFTAYCKSGIEAYCAALIDETNKKHVVLKSRGWGIERPFLNAFYPDPKIICMVRDLKDIVCSFEKMYRENPLKNNGIRNYSTGEGTTVAKRVDIFMNPKNPTGMAVERVAEIINLGYDDKILFVKYEDFCLRPDTEMNRIYNYLGIKPYQHDWDNIPQTIKEDDRAYGVSSDLHTIRPKLEMKPSDAKAILGSHVCNWLYDSYKWYYDKFGYKK